MWETIKQIILLGSDKQSFTKEQIQLLENFGLDTSKNKSQLILDALSLWEKMKSVGLQAGENLDANAAKLPIFEHPIESALSEKIALAFKYHEFYKIIPQVLSMLQKKGLEFPPEFIPQVLDLCSKDLKYMASCEFFFDERFYWLADKNKLWKFISTKADEKSYTKHKVISEKTFLLQKWLEKQPEDALSFLASSQNVNNAYAKELLESLFPYKNSPQSKEIALKIKAEKNKTSFGLASNLICVDSNDPFTKSLIDQISAILIVEKSSINIIEENIQALKKHLPKGMLPFKHLESYNNEFDKNLLFHALAICPPQVLFKDHFEMSVEDFVNTVSHLEFYDQLILQAMIYSASFFEHKALLNSLIKIFRLGSYDHLIWSPILSKLSPSQLNKELSGLLKEGEFDELCLQIIMEEKFNWPPKATQLFLEYLNDVIQHSYFNAKNPLVEVFKNLCLKCPPEFYRYVNEQFLSNNILSFQLHNVFKKYVNMLKLRYQIAEQVKHV